VLLVGCFFWLLFPPDSPSIRDRVFFAGDVPLRDFFLITGGFFSRFVSFRFHSIPPFQSSAGVFLPGEAFIPPLHGEDTGCPFPLPEKGSKPTPLLAPHGAPHSGSSDVSPPCLQVAPTFPHHRAPRFLIGQPRLRPSELTVHESHLVRL